MANLMEKLRQEGKLDETLGRTEFNIWEVLQNIPTGIVRSASVPFEFGRDIASSVGKKIGEQIPWKLIPEGGARESLEAFTPEGSKPITLPFQTMPVLQGGREFKGVGDFVARGVEAGAELAGGFLTLAGGSATKELFKQGITKVFAKDTLKEVFKILAMDATVGAGVSGGLAAQQEGATGGDIAKSAALGGVIGATAPMVLGAGLKTAGKVLGGTSRAIGGGLERVASKLEGVAEAMAVPKERFYQQVAKTGTPIVKKVAGSIASSIRTAQEMPNILRTLLLDKFSSLGDFTRRIKAAIGDEEFNKLDTAKREIQDTFQSAQYRAWGKASNEVSDYVDLSKEYGAGWNLVKEYSHYMDDIDRLSRGQTIAGDRGLFDVIGDMNTLRGLLAPEQKASVAQGAIELQSFLNRQLRGAVESGRLSEESYTAIKQAHPNYIPHDVLDFLDESGISKTGASFSITKSGIERAKGSVREIDDIDNAVLRRTLRNNILNEKNKAMKELIELGKIKPEEMGFIPLRTAEQVKKQMAILKTLKDVIVERRSTLKSFKSFKKMSKVLVARTQKALGDVASLLDEAAVKASDWRPRGEINKAIDRVLNADRKLQKILQSSHGLDISEATLNEYIGDLIFAGRALRQALKDIGIIKLKEVDVPEGFGKVSYFKDGIREDWLIPEDIANAIKFLDPAGAKTLLTVLNNSILWKIAKAPSSALRSLATTLNPVFALFSNPSRDIQTVQITGKMGAKDYAKGLATSIAGNFKKGNELYRLAQESGALQGSIFRETLTPEQILVRELASKEGGIVRKISNPVKLVQDLGQTMEEATRLGVFKRALDDGADIQMAAKMARNATVDFGKSGSVLQIVNQLIPFLNARVQGFSNILTSATKDPTKFARVAMYTAVYPTMLLYAHNQRYESFKNIPDGDKRKFWIVMVGESNGVNYDGDRIKIPHYIAVPKGEAQQAIANTTEHILNIGKKEMEVETKQFFTNLIGDISPVTDSSLLPTGLQLGVEQILNKTFFTKKPIEPDYILNEYTKKLLVPGSKAKGYAKREDIPPKYRFTSNTSELAKALGSALGWSPLKIDHIVRQGVLNDVLMSLDLVMSPSDAKKAEESGFVNASKLPFVRSILRSNSYGQYLRAKELEVKEKQKKNAAKIQSSL